MKDINRLTKLKDVEISDCRCLCCACEILKECRITTAYKNTSSLKWHTQHCLSFKRHKGKKIPSKIKVLNAIKKAEQEFGKDVSLSLIPELLQWGVLRQ